MPVVSFKHNLIKIGKRQYRNPVCLAKEWRRALYHGEYASLAALARHLKTSRARVTQIMDLVKSSPETVELISSAGDPVRNPTVAEKRFRSLLALTAEQQKDRVKSMLCR